jgi:uncharacterized protein (TIGR02145 family)
MKALYFKSILCQAVLVLIALTSPAQTFMYLVDFVGAGIANEIDSVRIHNITTNNQYTMGGSDTLVLWDGTVSTGYIRSESQSLLKIYPNPSLSDIYVETRLSDGVNMIQLFTLQGKELSKHTENSSNGIYHFHINGLQAGVYFLTLSSPQGKQLQTEKFIVTVSSNGQPRITRTTVKLSELLLKSQSHQSYFYVNCEIGDLFHFTAYAGEHSVVTPYYATESTTIDVVFQACIDGDLNYYTIVYIDEQAWMAENLATSNYSDGTPIPNVTNGSAWVNLTSGAYCWYNNNPVHKSAYGALYNWYATNAETNGGKNLCPDGWHVPTDAAWTSMTNYVGGFPATGGRLKETGFDHWNSPNTGATNQVAFSARPGGSRIWNGNFDSMQTHAFFWTSSEQQGNFAWLRNMFHNAHNLGRGTINKLNGFSIRCIKD